MNNKRVCCFLVIKISTSFTNMIVQPFINIIKLGATISTSTRSRVSILLLCARRIFEMQSPQMILIRVTTREDTCLVTIGRFKHQRPRLVRIHFHIQLNQSGIEGAFKGALNFMQSHQFVMFTHTRVDLVIFFPMSLLMSNQIVISSEPSITNGTTMRTILGGQMGRLVGGEVCVIVQTYGTLFFSSRFVYFVTCYLFGTVCIFVLFQYDFFMYWFSS